MKTIFKVGDRVFDYQHGWGEVYGVNLESDYAVYVKFDKTKIMYTNDGYRYSSSHPTLSFTEYTLEGFSQERPINYDDYIGKLGMFWDNEYGEVHRLIRRLKDFGEDEFQTDNGYSFKNFKPLTEEQIKILGL